MGNDTMSDEIWSEFLDRLRAYVRRRVSAAAVDDVVADILLRLVRSRQQMAAASNPVAWVYRVAANGITDHYRKAAREKRLFQQVAEDGATETVTADPGAEDTAALARCLVPMIRSLPAPYSQALMLTDIEGMSQTDAARHQGLSVSGMKSRVQRGRRQLKAKLTRCCEIETNRRGHIVDYKLRNVSDCCHT